jgi:hypothetical protein
MTPFVCHAAASGPHPATTGSGDLDVAVVRRQTKHWKP